MALMFSMLGFFAEVDEDEEEELCPDRKAGEFERLDE